MFLQKVLIIQYLRSWVSLFFALIALPVLGEPWVAPGNLVMRHDLQILADAGVVKAPVTTWPVSWADIALDLDQDFTSLDQLESAALQRVKAWRSIQSRTGQVQAFFRATAGTNPRQLRTFEATPRESGEVQAGIDWVGQRFAVKLAATFAAGADDNRNWRADDSYLALTAANWSFSAGFVDQWWGPGHDGSLILSNNARPFPAIRFQRLVAKPIQWRWLRWVGPWTFSAFAGQLEQDRVVGRPKILGMRFNFKPLPGLEVGASRTAQWGGDGRPETLSSFYNLLIGNDNRGGGITANNEPGNQLAGFDFRYSRRLFGRSFAAYSQLIGEDEAGGLPSRYLGQFGIETRGSFGDLNSYTIHLEYSDTTCDFLNDKLFNCAYNNSIYLDGYRFRDRVVGHSADNDSQILSLGGFLVDQSGHQWNLLLRHGDINRGGPADPRNTLTQTPQQFAGAELTHVRELSFGRLEFGGGLARYKDELTGESSNDAQAFIQLRTDL